MHTHQPFATAIACMENPELKMLHQNSLRFYERVAYDREYAGLATAHAEGRRLGEALGHNKDVLLMGSHGVLVVALTVSLAFEKLYYLERAAQLQVYCGSLGGRASAVP